MYCPRLRSMGQHRPSLLVSDDHIDSQARLTKTSSWGPEDLKWYLPALLNQSVLAVLAAIAQLVALVDRVSALEVKGVQHEHLVDGVNPVGESLGKTFRVRFASFPSCVLFSLLLVLATSQVRSSEFQAVTLRSVLTTAITSHVRTASLAAHLDSISVISRHTFTEDVILNVSECKRRCVFVDIVLEGDRRTRYTCELLQKLPLQESASLLDSARPMCLSDREHFRRRNGSCINSLNSRGQAVGIDISGLSK